MNNRKGISRYEYKGVCGWLVRTYKNNKEGSKLFADRKYGSKSLARKMAIEYKNALDSIHEVDSPPLQKSKFVSSSVRNTSGVIGVSKVRKVERNKSITSHWQASWRDKGRAVTRSFSVAKYGNNEARLKAISARHKAMVHIHGGRYTSERRDNNQLPTDRELNIT